MRRIVLAAVLAGLVVAGCANTSNRQPLKSYAAEANDVCAEFNQEAKKLPNPTTPQSAREYVDRTAELLRRQRDRLAEIEPPPRKRTATRLGWLEAQEQLAATLERQRERIASALEPDPETKKLVSGFMNLTVVEVRELAKRFPSLADLADTMEALGAKKVGDLPQEVLQRAAERVYAETDQGKFQNALQPVNERLVALTRQIGASRCFTGS